jgi:hypothetical protein
LNFEFTKPGIEEEIDLGGKEEHSQGLTMIVVFCNKTGGTGAKREGKKESQSEI